MGLLMLDARCLMLGARQPDGRQPARQERGGGWPGGVRQQRQPDRRARDDNLEIGVLVRGGGVPTRILEHFQALMASQVLRRTP